MPMMPVVPVLRMREFDRRFRLVGQRSLPYLSYGIIRSANDTAQSVDHGNSAPTAVLRDFASYGSRQRTRLSIPFGKTVIQMLQLAQPKSLALPELLQRPRY